VDRFDAQVLAYCLMGNHYHFVLHTRAANFSHLMRHVNGVYTQSFNRRHGKVGHLFQWRFKAILVDREAYLLEVCRYVELNPVRPAMVAEPGESGLGRAIGRMWAHVGEVATPQWLDTDGCWPASAPGWTRLRRLISFRRSRRGSWERFSQAISSLETRNPERP
jgi:putative transposase